MIRYSLKCDGGHGFEAWFRDSATYDAQAGAGEVSCPDCGSTGVTKALMAPAVMRGQAWARAGTMTGGAEADDTASDDAPSGAESSGASESGLPVDPQLMHYAGRMREMLVEMRRHIEANADHVGDRFAEEARKIHYGEADRRNIYGDATEEEAEALRDEGVEFGQIPWVPKSDA